MEQDRAAGLGEVAHHDVEFVLGADIDAAGRIEQQQDAAFGEQPFGDRDLLLVAAGESAGPGPQRALVDLDACRRQRARPGVSASLSIRPNREKRVDHRHAKRCALPLSFRNRPSVLRSSGTRPMRDIGPERIGRRADRHRLRPSTRISPCVTSRHAEAGEEKIELAHALQAGNAEDLAFVQIETASCSLLAGRKLRDTEAPARRTRHRFRAAAGRSGRSSGRRSSR